MKRVGSRDCSGDWVTGSGPGRDSRPGSTPRRRAAVQVSRTMAPSDVSAMYQNGCAWPVRPVRSVRVCPGQGVDRVPAKRRGGRFFAALQAGGRGFESHRLHPSAGALTSGFAAVALETASGDRPETAGRIGDVSERHRPRGRAPTSTAQGSLRHSRCRIDSAPSGCSATTTLVCCRDPVHGRQDQRRDDTSPAGNQPPTRAGHCTTPTQGRFTEASSRAARSAGRSSVIVAQRMSRSMSK